MFTYPAVRRIGIPREPSASSWAYGSSPILPCMSQPRPQIPEALRRELFEEAGYGCAIPGCGVTVPLDRAHLLDFAKTHDDRFGNQIILCKNHHGLHGKTIKTQDLRVIKAKLAYRQRRYSGSALEVLRWHATFRMGGFSSADGNFDTVWALLRDGYYQRARPTDFDRQRGIERCELTENGRFFTWAWRESGDSLEYPRTPQLLRRAA